MGVGIRAIFTSGGKPGDRPSPVSALGILAVGNPATVLAGCRPVAGRNTVLNALTASSPAGARVGGGSVSGKKIEWSNPSVLAFAGTGDPVESVEKAVRGLVLKAIDDGWAGPPFNPLKLADMLGIPVEASAQVSEARTVSDNGRLRIEFNPNRPRARTRFSVAHEIAHTLFPDVADRPRHRGGDGTPDDWQLEVLCNLAAAEIVMPIGSMKARRDAESIESLMEERARFDVSAEAFLIRVAKVSALPAMMCCFSPEGDEPTAMRLDYSTRSASWDIAVDRERLGKLASMCTAAGQTLHGTATAGDGRSLSVECIGIPGPQDAILPRVAVLVREKSERPDGHGIAYRHGDVLRPPGRGERIICQMVNDAALRWGGGVAAAAARDLPEAQADYSTWVALVPRRGRLGRVHFHPAGSGRTLASLVAQEGYGPSATPRIRYFALARALETVAARALEMDASVHMPRLGTGAAGGSWELVEQLVVEELVRAGVHVTVYDPPPRAGREQADLFS